MFVGVTKQQGNRPLAHITVAYNTVDLVRVQGMRHLLQRGRKLRLGKVFFFCCRRRHFFKSCLCAKVFFFFFFFFQCYALFSLFSFIIADGGVSFFFFLLQSVEGFFFFFFFLIQWVKVFSFPKISTSLKSKWCIPK